MSSDAIIIYAIAAFAPATMGLAFLWCAVWALYDWWRGR